MKTYEIEVFESLSRVIEVEAEDAEEAQTKVEQMYRNSEIILDSSDFAAVEFNKL